MKKFLAIILIFSVLFLGVSPNINNVSAENNVEIEEGNSELERYLEAEEIKHTEFYYKDVFSSIYDNVEYELTYYKADGTFESKAYDINTGKELSIEELESIQNQENQVIAVPNDDIMTLAFPVILIPVATWVFEHLIAMALAATIVSVASVTKDKVKSELEKRFKKKSPTIIYRGGSSTASNLTPKAKDTGGLSYYRKMPTGKFAATTKEAVDKTGVLQAVIDKANHVSVKPVKSSEMKGWINSRANANEKPHKFTKILQAISVSSKN